MVFAILAVLAALAGWFVQPLPARIAPTNRALRALAWVALLALALPVWVVGGAALGVLVEGQAMGGMSAGGQALWVFAATLAARALIIGRTRRGADQGPADTA